MTELEKVIKTVIDNHYPQHASVTIFGTTFGKTVYANFALEYDEQIPAKFISALQHCKAAVRALYGSDFQPKVFLGSQVDLG